LKNFDPNEKVHWIDEVFPGSSCYGKRRRSKSIKRPAARCSNSPGERNTQTQPSAATTHTTPKRGEIKINTEQLVETIKDLMMQHVIRKQLFAKEVTGISHQNLSNLLHKPEPWEKCDAAKQALYRKMYDWSECEEAIESLESLSASKRSKNTKE
jgi:hypothetical protein